jgi:hypothetical protein
MSLVIWLVLSVSLQAALVAWKLMQGWVWGYLIILEIPAVILTVIGLVIALMLSPGVMGPRQ